jgi:hypothetical protein
MSGRRLAVGLLGVAAAYPCLPAIAHTSVIAGTATAITTAGQLDPVEAEAKLPNLVVGQGSKSLVGFHAGPATVRVDGVELVAAPGATAVVVRDECSGQTLVNGAGCSVLIQITPQERGPVDVEVVAHHSGKGSIARARLKGTSAADGDRPVGEKDRVIDLRAPAEVRFDQANAAAAVMLSNSTDHPIHVESVEIIGGNESGMSVVTDGCGVGLDLALRPGANCALGVHWLPPPGVRAARADMIVHHDGQTSQIRIALVGKVEGTAGETTGNPNIDRLLNEVNPRGAEAAPGGRIFSSPVNASAGSFPSLIGFCDRSAILADGKGTRVVPNDGKVPLATGLWQLRIITGRSDADGEVWLIRKDGPHVDRHRLLPTRLPDGSAENVKESRQ